MRKTFQYRIYPTRKQRHILNDILEECRWVYNQTLGFRKEVWERCQESLTYYDTTQVLPYWKKQRPALKQVHSQVLQDVQNRVEKALRAFFRRVREGKEAPGFPRFKGKGRYDSFTFTQSGFGFKEGKLRLSKVG